MILSGEITYTNAIASVISAAAFAYFCFWQLVLVLLFQNKYGFPWKFRGAPLKDFGQQVWQNWFIAVGAWGAFELLFYLIGWSVWTRM